MDNGFIVPKIIETAQELYDRLILEGEKTFDEFSLELSKVSVPYNVLQNHPQELKDLTIQLLSVKDEIKTGLKYYLDNNMVGKLESFNYYDERSEQLKQAIKSFK